MLHCKAAGGEGVELPPSLIHASLYRPTPHASSTTTEQPTLASPSQLGMDEGAHAPPSGSLASAAELSPEEGLAELAEHAANVTSAIGKSLWSNILLTPCLEPDLLPERYGAIVRPNSPSADVSGFSGKAGVAWLDKSRESIRGLR